MMIGLQNSHSAMVGGSGGCHSSSSSSSSRRNMIQSATKSLSSLVISSTIPKDCSAISAGVEEQQTKLSALHLNSFSVYQVIPDVSLKYPHLEQIQVNDFYQSVATNTNHNNYHHVQNASGALWLGEHHNSANDHNLQADMIRHIYTLRTKTVTTTTTTNEKHQGDSIFHNMAIGLEQVQIQYQPILDEFIAGRLSESEMLKGVEWSTRWTWPYENYKPIFDVAKQLKIPLIALNVNSEDLAVVEVNGLKGLNQMQLMQYVMDPYGFGDFCKTTKFKTYSAYVIEPSYDLHEQMGILKTTISGQNLKENMSFRNFFSGRILWDESMAGNAFAWTKKNPGGLLIGLVGADHIKFELGVVGRFDRFMKQQQQQQQQQEGVTSIATKNLSSKILNTAVILNPTLIDSRPSGSVRSYTKAIDSAKDTLDQITLQLRYLKDDIQVGDDRYSPSSTGGVLKFSDYIVVNNERNQSHLT